MKLCGLVHMLHIAPQPDGGNQDCHLNMIEFLHFSDYSTIYVLYLQFHHLELPLGLIVNWVRAEALLQTHSCHHQLTNIDLI